MADYCYTAMDSPGFFLGDSDCDTVTHDLKITNGDLTANENIIVSAIIIQLNSDLVLNGERGFWADEFEDFPLGTHLWTLVGKPNIDKITVKADQMIRQSLAPLIEQGLIDDIRLSTTRTINGVEAEIDIIKNNSSLVRIAL